MRGNGSASKSRSCCHTSANSVAESRKHCGFDVEKRGLDGFDVLLCGTV